MRKSSSPFVKIVFAAAVICTVLGVIAIIAVFILYILYYNDVSTLQLIIPIVFCIFPFWGLHYSLTHDSLGRKIKPPAEPIYKKTEAAHNTPLSNTPPSRYIPTPTGRFVFDDEDFFFERMNNIANRFKLRLYYEVSWYFNECDEDELPMYEAALTGKYNFKLTCFDNKISIIPIDLNVHNYYNFRYNFDLLDDNLRDDKKAHKHVDLDRGFEFNEFSNDISVKDLSDDEIFDIVEKIIEALYGAISMDYEIITADDGKESFIFYLDAPDYYGYTETTEIGNFKFILNKENGGN